MPIELPKSDKKPYSIRLSESLMEDVQEYSGLMNMGKGEFINSCLSQYLKGKTLFRKDINFKFTVFSNGEETKIKAMKNIGYSVESEERKIKQLKVAGFEAIQAIKLNNELDMWENGTYKSQSQAKHYHEGLLICGVIENPVFWYVLWSIETNNLKWEDNRISQYIKINQLKRIKLEEALKLAKNRNNVSLKLVIELIKDQINDKQVSQKGKTKITVSSSDDKHLMITELKKQNEELKKQLKMFNEYKKKVDEIDQKINMDNELLNTIIKEIGEDKFKEIMTKKIEEK
jgi:hypothetical protein